jgi:acetyl-CoA C-acetyltransferase
MEALATAAAKINAGMAEQILLGGVESASRCPWFLEKTARPYDYFEPKPFRIRLATEEVGDPPMGETAEILADEFGIAREEMDSFALESHMRAVAARNRGFFRREIVAVPSLDKHRTEVLENDESVREDTSLEILAKLRPAFRRHGRVTAGNASPLSDGAAAALVCSKDACFRAGYTPAGWLTGVATVALDPKRMGMGPALAIPKLLDACALKLKEIDLFEINEAFAGQVLAVNRELGIPSEKLNVNGGAIAIGHPFGATGLRLVMTLIHAMHERGARRGVASLCIGGGQGMAVLIELQS